MDIARHYAARLSIILGLTFAVLIGTFAVKTPEASAGTWKCTWGVSCAYKFNWNETNALANWEPGHDSDTDIAILLGPFERLGVHGPFMWAYRFSARKAVAAGNCVAITPYGFMYPTRC